MLLKFSVIIMWISTVAKTAHSSNAQSNNTGGLTAIECVSDAFCRTLHFDLGCLPMPKVRPPYDPRKRYCICRRTKPIPHIESGSFKGCLPVRIHNESCVITEQCSAVPLYRHLICQNAICTCPGNYTLKLDHLCMPEVNDIFRMAVWLVPVCIELLYLALAINIIYVLKIRKKQDHSRVSSDEVLNKTPKGLEDKAFATEGNLGSVSALSRLTEPGGASNSGEQEMDDRDNNNAPTIPEYTQPSDEWDNTGDLTEELGTAVIGARGISLRHRPDEPPMTQDNFPRLTEQQLRQRYPHLVSLSSSSELPAASVSSLPSSLSTSQPPPSSGPRLISGTSGTGSDVTQQDALPLLSSATAEHQPPFTNRSRDRSAAASPIIKPAGVSIRASNEDVGLKKKNNKSSEDEPEIARMERSGAPHSAGDPPPFDGGDKVAPPSTAHHDDDVGGGGVNVFVRCSKPFRKIFTPQRIFNENRNNDDNKKDA